MSEVTGCDVTKPGYLGDKQPDSSVGGFYAEPGSGRDVRSFNVGWRFRRGAAAGAEQPGFDDGQWSLVNQLKEAVSRLSAEVTDLKAANVGLQQEKFM